MMMLPVCFLARGCWAGNAGAAERIVRPHCVVELVVHFLCAQILTEHRPKFPRVVGTKCVKSLGTFTDEHSLDFPFIKVNVPDAQEALLPIKDSLGIPCIVNLNG